MKNSKKSALKGFTLVELIVVVAVFGLLIAATLSFITPTRKVYKNASEYAGAAAMVDNVRRVVEDNLRFANRMDVYAGPAVAPGDEEAFAQSSANLLRTKFKLGASDRVTFARDRVYVMRIDNPEEDQFAGFAAGSQKPGRITIWQFDGGSLNTANTKEWAIAEGVYNEYSFSLSYGINFTTHQVTIAGTQWDIVDTGTYENFDAADKFIDPTKFNLVLDIYKNSYDDRANPASSTYHLARTAVSNTVALSFVNMVDGETNVALHDVIKETNPTPGDPDITDDLGSRYAYYPGSSSRDLYFVYTVPDLT